MRKSVSAIHVEVSAGELFDKITILEIKAERIKDAEKLKNVRFELDQLASAQAAHFTTLSEELLKTVKALKDVNERLWDIEDQIRLCERERDFGPRFVTLARAVYHENDRRAALKKDLNTLVGSRVVEEKSYANYTEKV